MHRGAAEYARQANWALDTTMAHYGNPPAFWQGDGVLTLALPDRRDLIRYLRRLELPIVALTGDVDGIATARVVLDNQRIGRFAAEHLLERGFRHLAFYKCTDYTDVRDREAGFAAAVAEAGLDYTCLNWYFASRRNPRLNPVRWLKPQLLDLPRPLGVYGSSDHRGTSC